MARVWISSQMAPGHSWADLVLFQDALGTPRGVQKAFKIFKIGVWSRQGRFCKYAPRWGQSIILAQEAAQEETRCRKMYNRDVSQNRIEKEMRSNIVPSGSWPLLGRFDTFSKTCWAPWGVQKTDKIYKNGVRDSRGNVSSQSEICVSLGDSQ